MSVAGPIYINHDGTFPTIQGGPVAATENDVRLCCCAGDYDPDKYYCVWWWTYENPNCDTLIGLLFDDPQCVSGIGLEECFNSPDDPNYASYYLEVISGPYDTCLEADCINAV